MGSKKIISESLSETLDELIDAESIDTSSLKIQDELNPDIWNGMRLKKDIRRRLLDIAKDFFNGLSIPELYLNDIYFLGSLASYNWNKYSDIDLHLVIDFSSHANEDEIDFLKDYFQSKKSLWNDRHDIFINGYEVEIYVQDVDDDNASNGVYSLITGAWIKQPIKENPEIPYQEIKQKTSAYINAIEELKILYDNQEYKKSYNGARIIKDKIVKMRRSGLEKTGEYGVENLTFKLLRRLGYIDLVSEIIDGAYDQNMSNLKESYVSPIGQYIENDYTPEQLKELRKHLLKAVISHKNSNIYQGKITWYDPSTGFDYLSSSLMESISFILAGKKVGLFGETVIDATSHHIISGIIVSTTKGKHIVTFNPNAVFIYDKNGYILGINVNYNPVINDILIYPFSKSNNLDTESENKE